MTTAHRSRGFTIVELLMVIGVIAVLLALLAPAVQRSRDAARLTQCKNHLKQFGLAFHNYHDTYLTFPPGWTQNHSQPGPQPRYGWSVSILPFIEQQELYDRINFENQRAEPLKVFQTAIPVYRCPEDPTATSNPQRGDFGTLNYSVNFGPVAAPRWLENGLSEFWAGQLPTPLKTNGLAYLNSSVSVRNIEDGTTCTFLIGERSATSGAAIWMGVRGNEFESDQVTDCAPGHEINTSEVGFSSRHVGGAHFLLGDGVVRFVNEKIASGPGTSERMPLYQRLSHRNDGQLIDDF